MAKETTEIMYDNEEDIFSLWTGKVSDVSIEIGDFIVDVDNNGYITGLEIINASKNLEISPNIIENIEKASLSVIYKPGYVYLSIKVKLKDRDEAVRIPLTLDLGHKNVEKKQVVFSR